METKLLIGLKCVYCDKKAEYIDDGCSMCKKCYVGVDEEQEAARTLDPEIFSTA